MASDENKPESGGADGGVEAAAAVVKDESKEVKEEEREMEAKSAPEERESAELKKEEVQEEEVKEEDAEMKEESQEAGEDSVAAAAKKKSSGSAEKEKEAVTPRERPSRERKAVERYWVASPASRASTGKTLSIEKGNGTQLRDIPNVAFKLSKTKPDDNLQLLHTILFGKKAKVHVLKRNIGQFSGFIWTENEEKQRAKLKEKLDKCVKEKLFQFCDVLNIPYSKTVVKKEDLTLRLLEFLESPHATTDVLLADKDQKGKTPKRTGTSTKSKSPKVSSADKSAKKTQSGEKRKRTSKADEENETDNKDDDVEGQSHSSEEEDDAEEKPESDEEVTESEEDKEETEKKTATPEAGSGIKSTSTKKRTPAKSTKSPAKSEKKIAVTSKKSAEAASSSKAKGSTTKKQKVEEKSGPVDAKSASKKKESKQASKEQGKANKVAKKEPGLDELRAQAVNILKEVDFNTATLSDILKLLGDHFGLDLMHRKVEVKAIITDVIENMSNADDDEDDEDSDMDAQDSGEE